MEAKEKAKELFDKYFLLTANAIDDNGSWVVAALNKSLAKQCVIITVEELFLNTDDFDLDTKEYWKEVKEQIENKQE